MPAGVDTVKSRGRTTGHQRKVIDAFVAAGISTISDVGVDRLSVSDVTKAAGASRPTFYSYFGNIAGLLAEMWLARGRSFLDRLLDPNFRVEISDRQIQSETRALCEIFTVSRRIPELAEVVVPSVTAWWQESASTAAGDDTYVALKQSWRAANRLGMWLTSPCEPRVETARILDDVLTLLGNEPTGLPADPRFATLPRIVDPVLANRTIEGQLMDAAVRVISTSGASAATMSRIARNAQVTTGTIYPRFMTNNDLLLGSFDLAISDVTEQNLAQVDAGGFAPDQFGVIVMAGLQPARRVWRNYRFEMYLEAPYNAKLSERLRESLNATNARVEQGLTGLGVSKGEREAVAYLIHTIGIGMAILLNNGVPVDTQDHRTITRDMVAALARR